MECAVCFGDCKLGIRTTWCTHLMESSDSVTLFELNNVLADRFNLSSNVITLVAVALEPSGHWRSAQPTETFTFPVLGVASRDDNLDKDLIIADGTTRKSAQVGSTAGISRDRNLGNFSLGWQLPEVGDRLHCTGHVDCKVLQNLFSLQGQYFYSDSQQEWKSSSLTSAPAFDEPWAML